MSQSWGILLYVDKSRALGSGFFPKPSIYGNLSFILSFLELMANSKELTAFLDYKSVA